jgi:hypothetical protein
VRSIHRRVILAVCLLYPVLHCSLQALLSGFTLPNASASGTPLGGKTTLTFAGLTPNTVYTLAVVAHCANESGCTLPYSGSPQDVAYPPVTFETTGVPTGGGSGGGGSGGLSRGAVGGIVVGALVGAALVIGLIVRLVCSPKPKGGGAGDKAGDAFELGNAYERFLPAENGPMS